MIYHKKENASIDSMNFWRSLKNKCPYLICPCSIRPRQNLIIIEELNERFVMVSFEDNPTKVSVLHRKDLVKNS